MFRIIDERPGIKLEVGMVIREFINDRFIREFTIKDWREYDIPINIDTNLVWYIVDKKDNIYVREFFKDKDFVK